MNASLEGRAETVKVILEACSDSDRISVLNHEDKMGDNALMIAMKWRCFEIVKVILEAYPDTDRLSALKHKDKEGNTALMYALQWGFANVVRLLLSRLPKTYRFQDYPNTDRLSALKHKDKKGNTELMYASQWGYANEVRLLLSRLPKTYRFQAISHIDNDGNNSLLKLCLRLRHFDDCFYRPQDTVKALFEPLSYTEKLAIVKHCNNKGHSVFSNGSEVSSFVMEQVKREEPQQSYSSILDPHSIFGDSTSVRRQFDCQIS